MFSGEERAQAYISAFDGLDPEKHYPIPYRVGRNLRNDLNDVLERCKLVPLADQRSYSSRHLNPAVEALSNWFMEARVPKPSKRTPETVPPLDELTG